MEILGDDEDAMIPGGVVDDGCGGMGDDEEDKDGLGDAQDGERGDDEAVMARGVLDDKVGS